MVGGPSETRRERETIGVSDFPFQVGPVRYLLQVPDPWIISLPPTPGKSRKSRKSRVLPNQRG